MISKFPERQLVKARQVESDLGLFFNHKNHKSDTFQLLVHLDDYNLAIGTSLSSISFNKHYESTE